MSRSTISTFQLFAMFPDEETAYAVSAVAGKRITYKKLTKGTTWFDAEVTA